MGGMNHKNWVVYDIAIPTSHSFGSCSCSYLHPVGAMVDRWTLPCHARPGRCHKVPMPSMHCWRPAKRRKGVFRVLWNWHSQIHGKCQKFTFCRRECNLDGWSLGVPNSDRISFNGWSIFKCRRWVPGFPACSKASDLQIETPARRGFFGPPCWRYRVAIDWSLESPNHRYCHQLGIAEICHETRRKMIMNHNESWYSDIFWASNPTRPNGGSKALLSTGRHWFHIETAGKWMLNLV